MILANTPPRVAVTLPPADWFGGNDILFAREMIRAIRDLGIEVFEFDTTSFATLDQNKLDRDLAALMEFAPTVAFGTPNGGYALMCEAPDRNGEMCNIFADFLGIPTIVIWDDPFTQFPNLYLKPLPRRPAESTGNALARINERVSRSLFFHCAHDSGSVAAARKVGILADAKIRNDQIPFHPAYREYGDAHPHDGRYDEDVIFAGNVYPRSASLIDRDQLPFYTTLEESVFSAVEREPMRPIWDIFIEKLETIPESERIAFNTVPDQTYFWTLARDFLFLLGNSRWRLGMLSKIEHGVAFYGGSAETSSIPLIQETPNVTYRRSVDFSRELPALYARTKVAVDVRNGVTFAGAPAKLLNCFVAGGFMLCGTMGDFIARLGDDVRRIMYHDAASLNERIDYFLAHEKERRELAAHFRALFIERFSLETYMASVFRDLAAAYPD